MWTIEAQTRIQRLAARGRKILIVEKSPSEVSDWAKFCRSLGYKTSGEVVQTETGNEWYQWWHLPKKRQTRAEVEQQIDEELHTGNNKWSARREGLVLMKG